MRSHLPYCLILAALATGCATSPGNMRLDPEAKRTVVAEVNYQLALKRLTEQWAECTPSPMLPIGQLINDVQHYPDLRVATIVRGSSGIGTQIHQVIDLKEIGPGRTEITLYTKVRADELASRTARIVRGDLSC